MIKSINGWAFDPTRPAAETFQIAREHGFEGVEAVIGASRFSPQTHVTLESSQDDCRRIADAAQEAGVKLVSLASGLGWSQPVTANDAATRQAGIEATAQSLRLAQWLGVDAILMVPGGVAADFIPGFPPTPYDVAYDNALAALDELKGTAEATGVSIGVENVWNKFLLSPLEFRDFLDKVGSARVGCYFDVGNVILTGYPEQWIKILGRRITRVHFKDFKREVGTLAGFCDLLQGDVDYPAVMAALREVGYDGPVTAEFFDCEADLAKISAAMDEILGSEVVGS
jgi:hexulose-6-phosphate isomerase